MEPSDPGLESLIRDIMIVASECEFDNDIHMLVNSLSYQDSANCSLDDLMDINDRYGDIVYNLISLREKYAQPIHELIDGPAFPLLLDEDQNPDEIKTALLMVSHTQKVQENNIGNFAPALKLHLEPPTTPPQVEGASNPSPLASNQQHALYPPLTQLASSPVQQGPLTGDNQLLSSLQEMSVCQLATRPFGSTSVRRRSHSWLLPGDAKHCHGHKRANSSSSSSNEVYHPHSLSMKKSRHLSESLSYSQMEPTAERIMDSSGGQYFGGGHRFAPRAMTLSPRPPSRPHPSTIYPAQAKGAR